MRRALLAALLACAMARAEDAAETKRYADATGKFSIALPADWEVAVRPPPDQIALRLSVTAKGFQHRFSLDLNVLAGAPQARYQAYYEREQSRGRDATGASAALQPVPHTLVRTDPGAKGHKELSVAAFLMRNRVGLALKLFCDAEDWPALEAPFFAAFATLQADVEEWPPLPHGFTRTVRDGYIYQRHPNVSVGEERKLHAFVRKQEKWFARNVAPVPKPEESRPMIALFPRRGDMRPVEPKAAVDRNGVYLETLQRRLFMECLSEGNEASVARELVYIFSMQAFGGRPDWLHRGEGNLAFQHVRTGKKPPWVTKSHYKDLPLDGIRFDFVAGGAGDDWERFLRGARGYTMFFHAGPSKYRKAFASFLKDLRTTGDWVEAERVHLLSLDQDELARDLQAFLLKRVRFVDPD